MHIRVKVRTGSKKEVLAVISKNHLEISVKEKPAQNLANRRVMALVALHYGVAAKQVRMVSGHHAPSKILSIAY